MGNEWVSGVDPDGRWVHIAIGAVIGGIVNWVSNGAKFDAKGLGFFGVGAVAGALSAGIGAGVNVGMAGGGFGAGFAGTATGVASTGVFSGFATGAAVGITNGFVSGIGNAIVDGQNIGEALNRGIDKAWKQGLTAGVTGGLLGGIDAYKKELNLWSGNARLDLSKGFGAHDIENTNQTITGKYVGKFEGVNMFESSILGEGAYSGGITLPGRGIIVGVGSYSKRLAMDLVHHEYGHILLANLVGYKAFYSVIGKESLISASMDGILGHKHNTFWTETWANYLSRNYFGDMYFGGSNFPVQNINWFNVTRLKAAYLFPFLWP
jgi:hypothetical protein